MKRSGGLLEKLSKVQKVYDIDDDDLLSLDIMSPVTPRQPPSLPENTIPAKVETKEEVIDLDDDVKPEPTIVPKSKHSKILKRAPKLESDVDIKPVIIPVVKKPVPSPPKAELPPAIVKSKPEPVKPSINSKVEEIMNSLASEKPKSMIKDQDEEEIESLTPEEPPVVENESLFRLTPQQSRLIRTDFEFLPVIDAPTRIKSVMKFYQLQGFCWMVGNESRKKGGILADEMGLGKTLMAIATCVHNPETSKRNLIIVPKSLLRNWEEEIIKHVDQADVSRYHGTHRDPAKILNLMDFTITTYGTVAAEFKSTKNTKPLFDVVWNRIIMDESHNIKNPRTVGAKACCALRSTYRWCLTGTPIHNELADLFSYFKFLKFEPYNDDHYFKTMIVTAIQQDPKKGFGVLFDVMQDIMLRRTKSCTINGEKILELQDKIFFNVMCTFTEPEQKIYDIIFEKAQTFLDNLMQKDQREVMKNYMWFLEKILRLKQVCDHYFLATKKDKDKKVAKQLCFCCKSGITDGVKTPCGHFLCDGCLAIRTSIIATCPSCSAPLEESKCETISANAYVTEFQHSCKTKRILEELLRIRKERPKEKILIFSQFTSFLDILEIPLRREAIAFIRVDGMTAMEDRDAIFNDFRYRDDIGVALLSIRACGTGLNLVEANHVFILDLWWNPQVEFQAIDRAHRIGQTKQVYVYKFMVTNSIEEKILKIQDSKAVLAEGVVGEDISEKLGKLSVENLRFMFEHPPEMDMVGKMTGLLSRN